MAYAEKTEVNSSRSRDEIERTLKRYGATGFAYAWERERAMVQFQARDRRVRFLLAMPDATDRKFTHTSRGVRTPKAASEAFEAATRQRWRALALVVKAKLEAVDAGISTFEEEFLAHILMPDGRTVADHCLPAIARSYADGKALPLLTGPGGARNG